MNRMKAFVLPTKIGVLTWLALLCLSPAPQARADEILLLAQTTLVRGSESETVSFTAPSDGTVTVHLTDLPWLDRMSALSFAATTATQVLSAWSALERQVGSFQVSAGTYFGHITAKASGALDLGLFSLAMTFKPAAPVPLPGSEWLLVTGLFVLMGLTRVLRDLGPLGRSDRTSGV